MAIFGFITKFTTVFYGSYFGILILYKLKQNGKTAVATNKYHEAAIEVMDNYFLKLNLMLFLGIESAIAKPDQLLFLIF
jgi:hypothetical protein